MPFQEPQRTDVDGIAVWFTDVPGPCMGGLTFRTGFVDETILTHGIDHLIEHLALAPLWHHIYDNNGSTELLWTRFYASGTQEEVETFLTDVCTHLRALPLDRLAHERRILETESRRRGGSFAGLASRRFGTRGIGVMDYPEHTAALTPESIEVWAAERFCAGQAVAWMTRPPSAALRLDLSPGPRLPVPSVEPLEGLVTPSHVHGGDSFVGCSMIAPRSMALFVAAQLFRQRAFGRLRTDLGLAYTVGQHAERISATHSEIGLMCDAPEHEMANVLGPFCEVLDELASGELADEEVRRTFQRSMPWNASDPARPGREASRKADTWLLGNDPTSWDALAAQGDTLTPETVQAALTDALATAILAAPTGASVPDRFTAVPYEPEHRRRFGRLYVRWDGNPHDQVTVNQNGVSREVGSSCRSAEFADVDGLFLGPDGTIYLLRRDGEGLVLEPNQLMRGRALVERVKDRLADRVVDLRGDVVGWFEMQTMLESHDRDLISRVWRELEILAEERLVDERVLTIAIAELDGHRGLAAVTDRRLLHTAHDRDPRVRWLRRADITGVETVMGIRGGRLRITQPEGTVVTVDRIRPRGQASELAALLTPIGETDEGE